jgi:hypothetical protein
MKFSVATYLLSILFIAFFACSKGSDDHDNGDGGGGGGGGAVTDTTAPQLDIYTPIENRYFQADNRSPSAVRSLTTLDYIAEVFASLTRRTARL